MPEKNIGTLNEGSKTEQCYICGQQYDQAEMVDFDGRWVCAGCKDLYVQILREGVEIESKPTLEFMRDGEYLVAQFFSSLPERCIKCNIPTQRSRLICDGIKMRAVPKSDYHVEYSLCKRHLTSRRVTFFLSYFLFFIVIIFFIFLFIFLSIWHFIILSPFLLIFIITVSGKITDPSLGGLVKYKDFDDKVWFEGACSEFLDQFTEWRE